MRISLARRAALAGCASLLLLLPASGLAAAEPEPAATLPAALVEAIERDLGISAEEFLTWSDSSQQLATAASELRRAFPGVFGGAWMQEGVPTVGLAPGSDEVRQKLREAVEALGFTTKDVAKSEVALRTELAGVQAWIDSLPEPVSALFRGAIIDLANNQMVVGLAETGFGQRLDLPDMMDSARILFSPANEVVPDNGEPVTVPIPSTDTRPGDLAPELGGEMLGGDAFLAGEVGSQFRCSLGFNATGPTGEVVNVTAGHCNPAGNGSTGSPATFLGGPEAGLKFGTFAKTRLVDIDYAVVVIDAPYEDRFTSPAVRGGTMAITGTTDPVVGMPVCKSGVTTGYSCGLVTSANLNVEIGTRRLVNGFTASICALQGDSGGTIVSGTKAVGISSASDVGDYTSCQEANTFTGLFGNTPQLYGVPIDDVLADNPGVTLRTG